MPTLLPFTRSRNFLLFTTLTLIFLADYFFYAYPLGWDTALFLGILAAAIILRAPNLFKTTTGKIILALATLILLSLVEQPTTLPILMSLLTLGSLLLLSKTPPRASATPNACGGAEPKPAPQRPSILDRIPSLTAWLARWANLLVTLPLPLIADAQISARWFRKHPRKGAASLLVPFRWIIPVAAGLVFLLLFIIANPILQKWATSVLNDLFHILRWLPDYLQPGRVLLWLLTGLITYGLLRHRLRRHQKNLYMPVPPIIKPHPISAHHFTLRCLIVFNLVFALQTSLDIVYLFGGTKLPPGMTYIQYAHRGAYPLVATAILAAIFVLAAFRTHGPAHRSPLARRLVYLWIAQNIFLMFSTLFRTALYIQATLLTELRVAVFIWIFLLALGFLFIIQKIRTRRSNAWLCNINALTLYAVLYICAFINFPGLIANFNVHHCREITATAEPLDLDYLQHLGPAALPALEWIRPQLPLAEQSAVSSIEKICADLSTKTNWRSWTLRRHRLEIQSPNPQPTR